MQLFLLAVDPDREGRPRFGPSLAPALVLADLLDKIRRGRPTPDSVTEYLRLRAPNRLDRYVEDAGQAGILEINVRREGYFDHTRIRVVDQWPLERAFDRLVRILSSAEHPHARDLAFVVLAAEAGRAQAHLKGRKHREQRRRLDTLVTWVEEQDHNRSVADRALRDGLRVIRMSTSDSSVSARFATLRD